MPRDRFVEGRDAELRAANVGSQLGKGTVFTIDLPLASETPPPRAIGRVMRAAA